MGFLDRVFGVHDQMKQSLGNVVITFYDNNNKASITSTVDLPKEEWSFLYALHLASTVYFLDDQDFHGGKAGPVFLEQINAYAQEILVKSPSGTLYLFGTSANNFPEPLAGEIKIVPEAPSTYRLHFEFLRRVSECR